MSLKNTDKNIVVSGASGFLGLQIIKQLLKNDDYNIIAISSRPNLIIDKLRELPKLKAINNKNWKNRINSKLQIDALINCAFPRTSDPEELAKGLLFTEDLIRDALGIKVKKIINISSQSVYSQKAKSSANENTQVVPESIYGMTKYASERITTTLCKSSSYEVCFSNIRLASLSGIGLETRMTNRFVRNALDGQPLTINGGLQCISYLDVRDAASAIIEMIKSDLNLWEPVYNLGNCNYSTVLELAEIVRDVAKEYGVENVKFDINEGQDNFNNLIESKLFYDDFKWKPNYTMELIVRSLFKYYKTIESK